MKISLRRSSSRMAACVSWPFAVTIISFDIRETPFRVDGENGAHRADHNNLSPSAAHGRLSEASSCELPASSRNRWELEAESWQLISKPTHPHVENEAEACQCGNHRRPAIAQQRKRQT